MKIFYLFIISIVVTAILIIDVAISQSLQPNDNQEKSYWDMIPEKVSKRNAFKRFEWFYRQRALPLDTIPAGAIERAREVEEQKYKFQKLGVETMQLTWTNIGPTGVVSTFPSQWGIVSGRVRAIAVHPTDPNIVYIGAAAGGIWKTTNGGTSWLDVGVDLASLTFGAISIDQNNPEIVYAGAGESMRYFNSTIYAGKGLYKSTDAGTSWTQITNGFGSTTHFGALRVSPTNSNDLFAALGSGYWHGAYPGNEGLWRSTDAGITWTRRLNVDDGFDVILHPTVANRVYGATGGGVAAAGFYRSTDNGWTWTKITTGLPSATTIDRIQIALPTSLPSTIYALIYNGTTDQMTLYKSSDDGSSWAAVSPTYSSTQGWYDLLLSVNPDNANEVYIGDAELRRSTNGGVNFSYVGGDYWNQSMHVDFHYMVFAPSNSAYRYVGCDGGIYRSTNSGSTWINLNSTLPTIQYYRLASHTTNQNIIMGGAQDNGIYKTTNGGVGTWTLVSTGDGMECFYDYNNPNIVYASTQVGGLLKSTTGGNYNSFASVKPSAGSQPWAWTAPFFMHPTNSSTIYTATDRPWRSTNGGSSWSALTGSAVTSAAINAMAQSPVDPNNMILVGGEWSTNPPVYVSSNGGTIWTNITTNIGGTVKYISRVVFHPTQAQTVFVVRSGFSAGNKIYRSINLGSTWTNITNDLPDVPHSDLFIDPINNTNLYTANDLGVYRSTNDGASWIRMGNNFPYVPALDFDYFNSGGVRILRVGTHGRSAYQAYLLKSISVTSPNGGEVWHIGSNQNIQWTSSGVSGNVKIDLSRDGGTTFEPLFANTANDGSESWLVTGFTTTTARIRVFSVDDPTTRDSSDANFNIVQPTITVIAPNGSETWAIGTNQSIQWTSSNLPGDVKIEFSRDAGSSYETLFASTPNDGTELWNVTGSISSTALIRITSVSIPSVSDVSDANFNIVQPNIIISTPNGGETWQVETSQQIQWTSSYITGNVSIGLSRNGGATYETLFVSIPNDDSILWSVIEPVSMQARIRIASVDNPSIFDVSDGNFTIGDSVVLIDLLVSPRWNLISVPVCVVDFRKSTLFPTAISQAFMYKDIYISKDTLQDGVGYWLKFSSPENINMMGFPLFNDTVDVSEGWNLIGSLSKPIAIADISSQPSGIVTSSFFGYNGSYVVTDTIRPGSSYWVKVNRSGQFFLTHNGSTIASNKQIKIVPTMEVPPPPPGEVPAETQVLPKEFILSQNYPNPFNPTATIRFTLPDEAMVTLKIHDILGRELFTVFDNEEFAAGQYEQKLNVENLVSGIYFYRLTAKSKKEIFSDMKKMLLIK